MVGMRSTYRTKMEIIIAGRFSSCGAPRRDFFVNLWQIQSKSIAEIISSYFSVGSISYNSWMPNKLGCCIMVIGSTLLQSFYGCVVNYHYTRFGEVLLFLCFQALVLQGLAIMKFIHVYYFSFLAYPLIGV